jgi:hypothetical protein
MSELTPEDALTNLFDSDTWPAAIASRDPQKAADIVVAWLTDSGFAIVDAAVLSSRSA